MNLRHPATPPGRWIAALLFAASLASSALAQATAATGTLAGRVFEKTTGKSLHGAIVRVAGTQLTDSTDPDGRYHLAAVPPGPQSVEVEYVGLDPFRQLVTVEAGRMATFDAGLKSEVLMLQPFEVAEAARGQALAINQQKSARGIVNVVSEETFGAMNDGNIGYVLQRLPGLTVNEGEDGAPEGVNIRGLASEFNSFQLDGNRLGTRGFSTRDLVADGIANIEVIKAVTPDKDGDAIGGMINVVSRSAFQRDGREVRLNASLNYLDLPEKWGHNLRATYSELFGILGETKNLGVSLTLSQYRSNRYYINNDTDFTLIHPEFNPTYNLPGFPFYFVPNLTVQYNLRDTRSYALNGSIDYRRDRNHSFYFKPLYSHTEIASSRYLSRPYVETRFQNTLAGRKTFEFLRPGQGRGTAGTNGSRGEIRYSAEENENNTNIYAFSFGGKHELGQSTLSYDFYYRHTHYVRTLDSDFIVRNVHANRGYFTWEYDVRNTLSPQVWVVNDLDPRDLSGVTRGDMSVEPEWRWENNWTGKLDWERKFTAEKFAGSLKFGAKYLQTKPKFEQQQWEYDTTATFPYSRVMKSVNTSINGRQMFMEIEPRKLRALLKAEPEHFPYVAYDSLKGSHEEDYTARESTAAGYGMATARIGRTTVVGGVRVERNTWESKRKDVDARTLSIVPRNSSRTYTEVLPGLHFRHALQQNLILRESYNRSYARPGLGRLTLGRSEDINGNIAVGNPLLNPTQSHNVDVQLEKYTAQGGLYSAGFYWKKMKGFYYNADLRFTDVDANGDPIVDPLGTRRYRKQENANGATNMGLELIVQQKLHFLPARLKSLTVNLSATFGKSDARYGALRAGESLPTFGFSDTMFNASLDYTLGKFRTNLRYSYRSDYLTGIGDNRYTDDTFAAREQVDWEGSYRLTRRVRLSANVINLTSRPQVSYQSYPQYVEDNSLSGWRATLGMDVTF